MIVFWYPFDFSSEWGFVHARLGTLQRVPFEAYYFGTEFRAVTEVFHKTGFFFPLGALLAVGAAGIRRRWAVPAVLLHAASALSSPAPPRESRSDRYFSPQDCGHDGLVPGDARRTPGICLPANVASALANRTREHCVAPQRKRDEMDLALNSTVSPTPPPGARTAHGVEYRGSGVVGLRGPARHGCAGAAAGEMNVTGASHSTRAIFFVPLLAGVLWQGSVRCCPPDLACAIQRLFGLRGRGGHRGGAHTGSRRLRPRGRTSILSCSKGVSWSASRAHGSVRQRLPAGWRLADTM